LLLLDVGVSDRWRLVDGVRVVVSVSVVVLDLDGVVVRVKVTDFESSPVWLPLREMVDVAVDEATYEADPLSVTEVVSSPVVDTDCSALRLPVVLVEPFDVGVSVGRLIDSPIVGLREDVTVRENERSWVTVLVEEVVRLHVLDSEGSCDGDGVRLHDKVNEGDTDLCAESDLVRVLEIC